MLKLLERRTLVAALLSLRSIEVKIVCVSVYNMFPVCYGNQCVLSCSSHVIICVASHFIAVALDISIQLLVVIFVHKYKCINFCKFFFLTKRTFLECEYEAVIYIYIIGWVAVQYHWILDESVPYLGESEGQAKYKQDESNVQ